MPKLVIRAAVIAAAVLISTALISGNAEANGFPDHRITLVVPFSAGGTTDVIARLISQKLSENLGQSVIVQNMPGGSSLVGAEYVSRQKPDGYTILMGATVLTVLATTEKRNPFDVRRQLTGVTNIVQGEQCIAASPNAPFDNIRQLVAYAKKHPGTLNFGSSGTYTSGHLNMVNFDKLTGTTMVHVPYPGDGPALTALMSGQIQLMYAPIVVVRSAYKAGKLKILGVASDKQSPLLPGIKTLKQQGVNIVQPFWEGLFAPHGTPSDIVNKLNVAAAKAVQSPDLQSRWKKLGVEPRPSSPAKFDKFVADSVSYWANIINDMPKLQR